MPLSTEIVKPVSDCVGFAGYFDYPVRGTATDSSRNSPAGDKAEHPVSGVWIPYETIVAGDPFLLTVPTLRYQFS
jgi:hypothetical protein